jgi:sulfoxide reductase heme-binding subunit YedZ
VPLTVLLGFIPLGWLIAKAFGWWHLHLNADPIAQVTDQLGLWALRLLLLTLCITPLRHATGWIRLTLLRRPLGLVAFAYVCLHLTLYVAIDQGFNAAVLWDDIVKRRWITMGLIAFLLLLPLALTSTRAAMRRLGRRWQMLHYAIYPAVLAACTHYYWQVKRDIRPPLVYATVFALLMLLRWVRYHRKSR